MINRIPLAFVIGSLTLGVVADQAPGGLVTWEFAGVITTVYDPHDLMGGAVTVGTPFSGLYTFESTTPDTNPREYHGVYPAITEFSGLVGPFAFLGPIGPNSIIVGLPSSSLSSAGYGTNVGIEFLGQPADAFLSLTDDSGTAFLTDALPVIPPDLDLFDRVGFDITARSKDFFVEGELTLLVPEPGTLVLLAFGAFLGTRRSHTHLARQPRK